MPPKRQVRLDRLWGFASSAVPDQEVKVAAAVANVAVSEVKREVALMDEFRADEVDKEFVKHGSRDRWGNLRARVGGRPKKVAARKAFLQRRSNRRVPGSAFRKEFPASEKLRMIEDIKKIQQKVDEEHAGKTQWIREQVFQKAVKFEFPTLQNRQKIEKLMGMEKDLREVIAERRLSVDFCSPSKGEGSPRGTSSCSSPVREFEPRAEVAHMSSISSGCRSSLGIHVRDSWEFR